MRALRRSSPVPVRPSDVVAAEYDVEEYDEDGRLYAFRFPRRAPQPVVMDRDRLFDYVRRRRPAAEGRPVRLLPDTRRRQYVRDLKNRADFFTDVRDLQTHADVIVLAR